MKKSSLTELMTVMRDNDPDRANEAFAEVILRYKGKIFAHAMSIHPNTHDADDTCQQVFAAFYLRVRDGSFENEGHAEQWLTCVAHNTESKRYQKQNRVCGLSDAAGAALQARPDTTVEDRDERADILRRIESIPAHREVVQLYYFQGLSIDEIAERLGLPYGTVQSRVHQARLALRRSYGVPEQTATDAPGTANTATNHDSSEELQTEVKQ